MDQQAGISEVQPSDGNVQGFHLLTPFVPGGHNSPDLTWLWEKVKTQDYAFDDGSRGNPEAFVHALLISNSANFYSEELGCWCLVRDLYDYSNPDIHFVVWNEKAPLGQIKRAGREVLSWVFQNFKVNRITAMIPDFNEQAKRFAIILRFQHEGVMKGATLYHGRWRNVDIFGLLRANYTGAN